MRCSAARFSPVLACCAGEKVVSYALPLSLIIKKKSNNVSSVETAYCFDHGLGPFRRRPASADDALKLAVGAPNNWDTCIPEVGKRAGIFKKHGLDLDILYTNGGGETMQAVISGSVDIGIAAGTGAVFGAFAKGAPVRILLAGTTGASDLYWYVPTASPLKTFADLNGKTVAYSTNGASTNTTLFELVKYFKVSAKPVATGAAASTLTQTMSGQVDVGWAFLPLRIEGTR